MCERPCKETEDLNQACTKHCEDQQSIPPCDRTHHTIKTTDSQLQHADISQAFNLESLQLSQLEFNLDPGLPIVSFDLKIKNPFTHPQFTETYAMTIGDLVSQLGGLMDLWLGFNIICIIHLIVYVTRYVLTTGPSHKHLQAEAETRVQLNEMLKTIKEERLKLEEFYVSMDEHDLECDAQLKRIKRDIEAKTRDLLNAGLLKEVPDFSYEKITFPKEEISFSNENTFDDGSRFWWLRGNKFYSVTPLEGYTFINESKNLAEVIFWYATLIVFTTLTVRDIFNTFELYRQKPLQNEIKMAVDTTTGRFPNFTLTLTQSLYEYLRADNTWLLVYHEDFPCLWSQAGRKERNELWIENHRAAVEELAEIIYNDQKKMKVTQQHVLPRLSDRINEPYLNWAEWYDRRLVETMNQVDDFLTEYRQTTQLYTTLESLISSLPMEERFLSFSAQFLRHMGVQFGWNQYWNEMVDIFGMILLESAGKNHYGIDVFLRNMTIEQLFYRQKGWLKSMIVTDIKLNLRGSKFHVDELTNEVEMKGIVPHDKKEITVKIYSKNLSLLLGFIRSLANHLTQLLHIIQNNESTGQTCIGCPLHLFACYFHTYTEENLMKLAKKRKDLNILRDLYVNTYLELQQFYEQNFQLQFETASGGLELKAFHNYELELVPTGHYKSLTDTCSAVTMADCIDECMFNKYLEECNCWPWMYEHMKIGTDARMCAGYCNVSRTESCGTKCAEQVAHPCNLMQFRITEKSQVIKHADIFAGSISNIRPDLPLISLKIRMKRTFIHPAFIEKYLMSAGMLVSQLGGRMELYLGLNVVSVVHLVVYMVRQCFGASNKKTKTGSTVRRLLCGCSKQQEKEIETAKLLDDLARDKDERHAKNMKRVKNLNKYWHQRRRGRKF